MNCATHAQHMPIFWRRKLPNICPTDEHGGPSTAMAIFGPTMPIYQFPVMYICAIIDIASQWQTWAYMGMLGPPLPMLRETKP